MPIKRSHLLATAVLALAISGCGGSDGGGDAFAPGTSPGASTSTGSNGNGSGQTAGSFISRLMEIIGITAENSEPVSIESITVTEPQDTEPVPLS